MSEIVWDEARCHEYTENMRRVVKFDHTPWARELVKWLPDKGKNLCFADVATGPGFMLHEMGRSRPDIRLIAFDGSELMIEIARREAAAAGVAIEAHVCPATALPLPDGSVDAICAKQLFNQADGEAILVEMARVLRPGGLAFVIDFDQACSPVRRWVMGAVVVPVVGGRNTARAFRTAVRRALDFTDIERWLGRAGLEPDPRRAHRGVTTLVIGRRSGG